jgi:rhodanese-related sulfurtransferase
MRASQLYLTLVTLLSLFWAAACSSSGAQTPTPGAQGAYRTLTIDEFAAILEGKADEYTVVNVHIPYEGEIEGTDAEVPYNDVGALTSALPDKDAPIILYCRSGRMSEIAGQALADLGYTQIYDVPGGMIAWQSSGRQIVEK